MNTISFPGLGIGPFTINPVAFSVFGVQIRWYGIIMCLSIIAGFMYFAYRVRDLKMNTDDVLDVAIITIPCAIIGARLYYVLTSLDEYDSFWEAIAIWNGGIAIYGAIIGGAIGLIAVCKRKKKSIIEVFDCAAPAVMLGQITGRWGNFTNAEAYGDITKYDFFGKIFETPTLKDTLFCRMTINSNTVHPTFLYESVWNILGFILINIFYKKKKYNGQITLWYIVWYGLGRCLIEGLRTDSLWIGTSFRISQLLALLCFVTGIVLLIIIRAKNKKATEEYVPQFENREV